jgi:arginyl-tRNA synthetase
MRPRVPCSGTTYKSAAVTLNTAKQFNHHYQCNDAMAVFKQLKALGVAAASPLAVAEAVVAATSKSALIGKLEVSRPGFINVFLSSRYAADSLLCDA